LDVELAALAAVPEGLGVLVDDRDRKACARVRIHHGSFENTIAPVGTTLPLVTSECVTFGAWVVDVPRT
jgi:hypothetical protein